MPWLRYLPKNAPRNAPGNALGAGRRPLNRLAGIFFVLLLGIASSLPRLWAEAQAKTPISRDEIAGPINADLIEVIDGDTLSVRIAIWPGQTVQTLVRLEGVDTPELKGKCAAERSQGAQAKAFVQEVLGDGPAVLRHVRFGKYAGRVLARVATRSGDDVAHLLIERGFGRVYAGGRRQGWCGK